MIEETVRVVAVDADAVWIEARRQSACGRCAARSGCGHGLLDELRSGPVVDLRLPRGASPATLAAGDQVVVGIDESALLRASLRVYGLPLLGLLLGAGAGDLVGGSDALAALGAGVGVLTGFLLARAFRDDDGIETPRILRQLAPVANEGDVARPVSIV